MLFSKMALFPRASAIGIETNKKKSIFFDKMIQIVTSSFGTADLVTLKLGHFEDGLASQVVGN